MTSEVEQPPATANRARLVWFAVAIGLVALLPFLPALRADFVRWDDDQNFLRNSYYRGLGLSQLKWMWTTFHMGHYVPLTWMTLGADYLLWGMDARGYHLTNLVLHAGNAVAIFFVSRRLLSAALAHDRDDLTITWGAAFAATIFAIHPLRVESVAWVTERRDVLSGLLYSLTVLFYLRAIEHAPLTSRRYAPVFALCLAALLSKATAMTLPAMLLLLNVYPLRRLKSVAWSSDSVRQVFRELAPLILLSIAAILLSLRALPDRPQISLLGKVAVSSYSLSFYFWKTLFPVSLGPLYPLPNDLPFTSPAFLASYAVVACVALFLALQWMRWPGIAAAVSGFLIAVLPMLGIVQNGPQIAADRYTYHAAPALALLAGAAFAMAWRKQRVTATGTGALILAVLGTLTWVQTGYWNNSKALWTHAVRVADNSSIAHDALGTAYFFEDSTEKALEQYKRAAELSPDFAEVRVNIAVALAKLGRLDESSEYFRRALELNPQSDFAENAWGVVLATQGSLMAAIGHYRLALAKNPDNADAELNWGNALASGGNLAAALPHYKRAAALNPVSVDVEAHWGATLAQQGRLEEALPHFQRAVALDPKNQKARKLLERALSERAAPASPRQ